MKTFKSDSAINKEVKIQGTNYDRKRKVTKSMRHRMEQMYNSGKSYNYIGNYFGVSPITVRYNLDEDYKKYMNKKRKDYPCNWTPDANYYAELAEYKRELMKNRNFRRAVAATV